MYRQHAGPPLPDPFEAGEKNARACGHVQLGSVGMVAISVALAIPQFGTMSFISAEAKKGALLYAVVYVLVLAGWAGLNAWGLRRRSKIAHYSSLAFAIVQLASCFGTVFGAGLLLLLFKKEMRGYYDARLES